MDSNKTAGVGRTRRTKAQAGSVRRKNEEKHLIITAGLLVCSMLAGCGSGGGQESGNASQGNNSTGEQSGTAGESGGNTDDGNVAEITFPLAETYSIEAFAFSNTGQELDKTLTMQMLEERTNIHWNITTVGTMHFWQVFSPWKPDGADSGCSLICRKSFCQPVPQWKHLTEMSMSGGRADTGKRISM